MPASAGILMYRRISGTLEVLLVHPGGPFWRNKDEGAWSIPKGEMDEGESPEEVARREFMEELGSAPAERLRSLGEIRQRGGKRVPAFAVDIVPLGAALIPSKSPLTLKRNHDLILIRHYAVSYPLSFFQIEISRRKPYPAYTYLFKLLINFSLHPIKVIIRHGRSPSFNITDHGFAPAQSLKTF
jgi:8-oxo-dGTP pyrophosphatase MutT (NUDIX family)